MDKVQKIREEVVRIQLYTQSEVLKQVLDYIDEVRKEYVSNSTPNEKMSVERWKKACEAACCDSNYRSHFGLTETRDDYFVDGVQWADEHPKEEPVSEELEDASKEWLIPQLDKSYANYGEVKMMELTHFDGYAILDAIEFGAQWQKTKDESTTEDLGEYINELSKQFPDVSFAKLSRIAVRVAKWQKEQLMKDAVNGLVYAQRINGEVMLRSNYVKRKGLNFGDKVKVIVIKED